MERIKGVKRIGKVVLIIVIAIILLGVTVWYIKTEDGVWRDQERGNPSSYTGSASISETEGIVINRGRIVNQALYDLLYEYDEIEELTEQDIIRILDMSDKLGRNIISLDQCTDAEILWCTSEEYKTYLDTPEDLEKLLNAELVTQYPRIDDLPEDKLNGIIEFERFETDPDTNITTSSILTFIKKEDFQELFDEYQENGNREVLQYFSLDDEGNVIIATWEREEGDYSSNNTALQTDRKKIREGMTEDKIKQEVDERYEVTNYSRDQITAEYVTYTITEQPIYYKNHIQQYTMPFEYLWSLLVMGESDEFVLDLAETVHNTEIKIGIFDNINKSVTTNIEKYTEEFKDRTETWEKNEGDSDYTIVGEEPSYQSVEHISIEDDSPDEEWDIEIYDYEHTEIVTTYQDIPQIQVIYANTWIVEVDVPYENIIDTEEIYNDVVAMDDEPWDDSDCYTDSDTETRRHPDIIDPLTLEVITEGEEYTVDIKKEYYKYKHAINKSNQSKLDVTTSTYYLSPADIREKTEIVEDDEINFIELIRDDSTAFTYLTDITGIEWLAHVLSNNQYTTRLVDLTRYLLNKAKDPDNAELAFDFSIFEPTSLSSMTITGIYGGTIQEKVWNALKNLGYSDISVAAAMGNIDYESGGFNPSAVEGGSGAGIGLIQWSGGRRIALEAYAASKGVSWQDEDTQIEFLVTEISGQGRAVGYASQRRAGYITSEHIISTHDDWASADTVDNATLYFMRFFESPASTASLSERQQRAHIYYQEFQGRQGIIGGSDTIVGSAIEVHRYVRENRYSYAMAGISVPNYRTKTIDCSSYVTWVLVNAGVSGFTEGMYQATSSVFYSNPWGFAEVSVGEALPGDIVVYSGHVEIVAYNDANSNKFRVYNCGGSASILAAGTPDLPEASTSGHTKNSVLKVLRVN